MKTKELLELNNEVLNNILNTPMIEMPLIIGQMIRGQIMANKDKIVELEREANKASASGGKEHDNIAGVRFSLPDTEEIKNGFIDSNSRIIPNLPSDTVNAYLSIWKDACRWFEKRIGNET